jgi:hypothetical protein
VANARTTLPNQHADAAKFGYIDRLLAYPPQGFPTCIAIRSSPGADRLTLLRTF